MFSDDVIKENLTGIQFLHYKVSVVESMHLFIHLNKHDLELYDNNKHN